MNMQEQGFASMNGERPGIEADPGDAWGTRAGGGIAPAFDYMDEEIEEAMIAIGGPEAASGTPESTEGRARGD